MKRLPKQHIVQLREDCANGMSDAEAAIKYKVHPGTVANIRKGHTHKSAPGPITRRTKDVLPPLELEGGGEFCSDVERTTEVQL